MRKRQREAPFSCAGIHSYRDAPRWTCCVNELCIWGILGKIQHNHCGNYCARAVDLIYSWHISLTVEIVSPLCIYALAIHYRPGNIVDFHLNGNNERLKGEVCCQSGITGRLFFLGFYLVFMDPIGFVCFFSCQRFVCAHLFHEVTFNMSFLTWMGNCISTFKPYLTES